MAIQVKCQCGRAITVADSMAGSRGRCPECDAVLTIPAGNARPPRTGAFMRVGRDAGHGGGALLWFAALLWVLALVAFFVFAGVGVFAGVTALKGAESFRGPFGLFSEFLPIVEKNPSLVGAAFILGGLLGGALAFVLLAAIGQFVRLLVSLDRTVRTIADRLERLP
ncbi:MAG: hypothetical protein MUE73_19220 [Planctomycetes bacterium]|jgi:hypothetical protein|nr:hypothetical protein [Planctomycetota bacterium]